MASSGGLPEVKHVTIAHFRRWHEKVTQFETVERQVWIQSRANYPDLDKDLEVAPWLLKADEVDNIDLSSYWAIDYHVPHGKIGRGAWLKRVGMTERLAAILQIL